MVGKLKSTNCDKLWRVWYVVLVGSFQVFLIYVGINRYLVFKSQAFDAKYGGEWDQAGLNFTLAMLISAMTFFSLFTIVSLSRTVNYANEGTQIGRDTDNLQIIISGSAPSASAAAWRCQIPPSYGSTAVQFVRSNGAGPTLQRSSFSPMVESDDRLSTDPVVGDEAVHTVNFDTWSARSNAGMNPEFILLNGYNPTSNVFRASTPGAIESNAMAVPHVTATKSMSLLWKRIQRHFLPYSNFLHILTALCLLLPIAVVHAQQIYHRVVPSGWIWRSELDLLFGSDAREEDTVRVAPFPVMSPNSKVFGGNPLPQTGLSQSLSPSGLSSWDDLRAISPEFFNLALALFLLVLHYPSVFWYTNRSFAFVFSLLLFAVTCSILIEYNSVVILVKLAWNRHLLGVAGEPGSPDKPFVSWATVPFASVPGRPAHLQTQMDERQSQSLSLGNRDDGKNILQTAGQEYPASKMVSVLDENGLVNITPMILSSVGNILFLLLFITVFEYGYRQFIDSLSAHRHYLTASANERAGISPQITSMLGNQQQPPGDAVMTDQVSQMPPQGYNTLDAVDRRSNLGTVAGAGIPLLSNQQYLHRNPPLESLESLVNGSTKSNHYGSNLGGGGLSPAPALGNGAAVPTIAPVDETNQRDGQHWFTYNTGAEVLHPYWRFCLSACLPRMVALSGCLIVLAFKLPIIIDCLRVYWRIRQTVMLFTPLSCGVAISAWLIAWFAFSLKPAWKFQVNLPTQPAMFPSTAPTTVYGPNAGQFPVSTLPVNYFQGPLMTGSVLRTPHPGLVCAGGLGSQANTNGCLVTSPPVGFFSPPNLFAGHPEVDEEAEQPGGQAREGEANGRVRALAVSSGSPVYACFHETLGTGVPQFATASGAGMLEMTTFPVSSGMGPSAGELAGSAGQINGVSGMYGLEYCSEDTEVSSGRHSGNNYVCLQSALHSNSNVGLPANGIAPATSTLTATAGDLQRQQQQTTSMLLRNRSLLQSVITTAASGSTPTCSGKAIPNTAPGEVGRPTVAGTTPAYARTTGQLAETPGAEGALSAEADDDGRDAVGGRLPTETQYRSPLGISQTSAISTVRELDSHRVVSCKDSVSEAVGSHSLSAQNPQALLYSSGRGTGAKFSDGVAQSSTPSTFRSTVVFRSPCANSASEYPGQECQESTSSLISGNPPQTGGNLLSRSGVTAASPFYQRSQMPDAEGAQPPGIVTNSSSTSTATGQALGLPAMIGDSNASMQMSNGAGDEEQYPLLLPPCLLGTDSQGARLCSQV